MRILVLATLAVLTFHSSASASVQLALNISLPDETFTVTAEVSDTNLGLAGFSIPLQNAATAGLVAPSIVPNLFDQDISFDNVFGAAQVLVENYGIGQSGPVVLVSGTFSGLPYPSIPSTGELAALTFTTGTGVPYDARVDVDNDGDVDQDDLNFALVAAGTPAAGPDDRRDFNGDGVISVADMLGIRTLFTAGPVAQFDDVEVTTNVTSSDIPEASSLAVWLLLALAFAAFHWRPRRR